MNKEFMEKIYDKFYVDPIYEIVRGNDEYKKFNSLRSALQKRYQELASDELVALHNEIVDVINLQTEIVAKEMYIRGMEDRDHMR